MRLAQPRLGDAGIQAILELVGERDRVKQKAAQAPQFVADDEDAESAAEEALNEDVSEEDFADESSAEATGEAGDESEEKG